MSILSRLKLNARSLETRVSSLTIAFKNLDGSRPPRWLLPLIVQRHATAGMKRKALSSSPPPKSKKIREKLPEYCAVETRKAGDGSIVWPAPEQAIEAARAFLRKW
jgi:hypothetical protein